MTVEDSNIAPAAFAKKASSDGGNAVRHGAYLINPVVDFLCLGGGSLFVLAVLVALDPTDKLKIGVAVAGFLLSHLVNYPHFAHSYQIFYRNFTRKLIGAEYGSVLRLRYFVAGILAPSALILFFITSIARDDAKMLGLGGTS